MRQPVPHRFSAVQQGKNPLWTGAGGTLDGPLGLLQKCGLVLHHGNLEQEDALSALNPQERAELERMLSVLLADWEKRMPEGLSRASQGRGRGHH